jgi:cell division protein FtsB
MSLFEHLQARAQREYRVHHHDPIRRWLLMLLAVVLLASAGWALYGTGYKASGYHAEASIQQRAAMRERIAELQDRNDSLTKQVAELERNSLIERQSAEEIRAALVAMEARLLEVNEELSFYKSILSPADMEPGLHVQSFEIEPGDGPGEFLYKLVLHQVRGNDRVAKGEVEIDLSGRLGGEARTLKLAEFSAQGADALKFSFKYFQSLEGAFLLPKGFEPADIEIRVKPSSRRLDGVEATYVWKETLVGDNV